MTLQPIIIFFSFILGLVVGSFLNALIFRLRSGESILLGRSHCVHCKHELGAKDLIPLFSFIFLQGKCRYCGKEISWQYPLVELITGIVFVLFTFNIHNVTFNLIFNLIFACFLIVIAVFDFKHYLILDKVLLPVLVLVIIRNIFFKDFLSGLEGMLIVAGFFYLQYFFSKGRWIGFGDVKFGLFLGNLFGLKLSLFFLFLSYILGGIAGIILLASKKKKLSSKLPFGVFLSISAIIMMLIGDKLADWYLRIIGL
jgi:leader peptidase (prepilin peptidase)/N-methyltransferase